MDPQQIMGKAEFGEEVAATELVFVKADGTERLVRFRVGRPYAVDGHWRCPCESHGYDGRYPDIAGIDSMHALSLALELLRTRAEHLLEKGGRIQMGGEPDDSGDPHDRTLADIAAMFGGRSPPGN